jgi:hypothetical protein
MVGVIMAHLKYHSVDIFLRYLAKAMWKHANFRMDFALKWLDMVGIVVACLHYHTLYIFL